MLTATVFTALPSAVCGLDYTFTLFIRMLRMNVGAYHLVSTPSLRFLSGLGSVLSFTHKRKEDFTEFGKISIRRSHRMSPIEPRELLLLHPAINDSVEDVTT